jgi:Ca-activated chloride channel family protein
MKLPEFTSLSDFFSTNLHLANPWILLLIPIIWIAYYIFRNKQNRSFGFSDLTGLKANNGFKIKLLTYLPYLNLAGISLLIIALARPQSFFKDETIKANGIDIMMAIDLSSSMLSRDFDPDRLSVAKEVAGDFIDKRMYDRIGLVAFSGEAFTQSPVTTNHDILKQMLGILQPGILSDGTAIGMGLATAVNRLKDSKAKSKVIILMTDGVNNAGYIKPQSAGNLAKTLGIKVYTIGIGSTGQALTPVARRFDGSYVYGVSNVEIDEKLLFEIAEETGGKYFRARTGQELAAVYNDIDKMEKTTIDAKTMKKFSEEFRQFMVPGVLFLALAILLKYCYIKPMTFEI